MIKKLVVILLSIFFLGNVGFGFNAINLENLIATEKLVIEKTISMGDRQQEYEQLVQNTMIQWFTNIENNQPLFYKECISTDIDPMIDAPDNHWIHTNACGPKYQEMLTRIDSIAKALFGEREKSTENTTTKLTKEDVAQFGVYRNKMLMRISHIMAALQESNQLTDQLEVGLYTLIYLFDGMHIGAELQLIADEYGIDTSVQK